MLKYAQPALHAFWAGSFIVKSPSLIRNIHPKLRNRLVKAVCATLALTAVNIRRGEDLIPEIIRIFSVPIATCFVLLTNMGKLSSVQRRTFLQRTVLYGSIPTYASALPALFGYSNEKADEVDILALISIILGVLRKQDIAALVILLMVTGGEALEHAIEGKAKRSLDLLLQSIPRRAHRVSAQSAPMPSPSSKTGINFSHSEVDVNELDQGDMVLVKPGDMVPVDCVVVGDYLEQQSPESPRIIPQPAKGALRSLSIALVDESRLTGEHALVQKAKGDAILSGCVNSSRAPMLLRVVKPARDSVYQAIGHHWEASLATKAQIEQRSIEGAGFLTPFALTLASATLLYRGWDAAVSGTRSALACQRV
jgi:cation transport ATPase